MPASVLIQSNVIPCDDTSAQCPTGWTCGNIGAETGVGKCVSPDDPDPTAVNCPDLGAIWAETTDELVDPAFPIKAACLAQQGISGCGFEQQLQSAATALVRGDQVDPDDQDKSFIHNSHLLTILVVSDEEDCSMEDGQGLFNEDEVQNQAEKKVNLACGNHPEYLYDASYFYDAFVAAKTASAVMFAAIVGVPYGTQDGAEECQGPGGSLDDCLDQEAMQLDEEQPKIDTGDTTWFFRPACTRGPAGPDEVTRAFPGRRYVELANESFGDMSYVYSICNEDWSMAMTDIAAMIASKMAGTCYEKPLDWDPVGKVAKCNVVVEYTNPPDDECPEFFGEVEPVIKQVTTEEGEDKTLVYCPIPKIAFDRSCGTQEEDLDEDEFGWYYCENLTAENFPQACVDGIDNDGDGQTDCDDTGDPEDPDNDPGCTDCEGCPDAMGVNCEQTCTYVVMLTGEAQRQIAGMQVSVQCLQQFSFEDKNCQEDTQAACTDSADNDGNGIWDCSFEEDGSSSLAEGEKGHVADPNCCPMVRNDDNDICNLEPVGLEAGELWDAVCPSDEVEYTDGYPDACREAASRLQCTLP